MDTNGNNVNREQYDLPATLYFNTSSPSSQGSLLDIPIGEIIFTVVYEFSGFRAPGLSTPMTTQPQSIPQKPEDEKKD